MGGVIINCVWWKEKLKFRNKSELGDSGVLLAQLKLTK